MALTNSIMRYVGNEMLPAVANNVAKDVAVSSLGSILPSAATKLGTGMAASAAAKTIPVAAANSMAQDIAVNGVTKPVTSTLSSLVPTRQNWKAPGDIEGMLDGKFLGTNDNYFPSVFSEGALNRATYGPEQPVDQRKVAGLVRAIKNNEDIAPIAGFKNNDGFIDIYDGHHRLAAYQKAGKMPRVKLFDNASKDEAYAFADEWANNAIKEVQQYLPPKQNTGLDEYGMGTIKFNNPSEPKIMNSLADEDITLFHGTPNKFEDFDESLPSVWFSNSDKNLRDTGLTIRGGSPMNIMKRSMPSDLKIADEDLADRLTKSQLKDRGYAGIAYTERGPNGDETYYEIFEPNKTLNKINDEMMSLAGADEKYARLLKKAKGYKSLERFEKMNNPIKGSEIWGEKPKSYFERDSRAVRINMFPNEATKGTGITKQYLLNLFKDAYDQGITSIIPSYGSYTKEGASFMDHLAEQGWVKATGSNGWNSYEIAPKIAKWKKTTPLADIYNSANGGKISKVQNESLTEIAKKLNAMKASRNMSDDIRRIGSAEVAALDEGTLPEGWKQLEKYLDTADKRLEKALGKPRSKITKDDLISFLEDYGYDTEGTKNDLWKNALMCIDDMALDELYEAGGSAGQFLQDRLPFRHNSRLTDATNYYIGNKGRTGRLDAEYSDRLGIGRSNTPMSDRLVNPYSSAGGDYSTGAFGTDPTWATGESGVSTAAHERLHAWQDINKYDWNEEVVDAIDELRGELQKYYHDEDTIKKYWGNSKTDYYAEDIEQEARMLQSYLDNEGFTNTYRKSSEKGTEWGDEIKPAFDRFFKKLRALSKKGIALPAIAGLVGIGAMAGGQNDKKLDN